MPNEPTTKNSPGTKRLLAYLCALVLIAGVVLLVSQLRSSEPPAGSGYYTGPMLNKAGTHYTTDDGHIVPPPPGSPPIKGSADGGKSKEP